MALLTQKAIMSTFEAMLEEMPFEKITVSSLVKRSGVSSNTFYYHYQDIYALLFAWISAKLKELRAFVGEEADWKVESKQILHYCQDHPKITYHVFNSLSLEQLEQYVFSSTDEFFYVHILNRVKDSGLSNEQVQAISDFCKFAYVGFFIKFLWNKMEEDVDSKVEFLGSIFENFIEAELKRASEEV